MPEELPTALKVRDEVKISFGLEGKLQTDEERAFKGSLKDFALANRVRNLFLCNDLFLRKNLHGVDSLGVVFPHLEDTAKRPPSDKLEKFKVMRRKRSLGLCGGRHEAL